MEASGAVTRLLSLVRQGDGEAREKLFVEIQAELRRIAGRQLRRETPGRTLQPTALVNEAYLKLAGHLDLEWANRAHFFAVAARAMRQVLIDRARERLAQKRGGGADRTTLTGAALGFEVELDEMLALNEALDRLEKLDPRLRQVVEYRFFGGLEEKEIAELLGVTTRTVERYWTRARAWLYKELYPSKVTE
ncbi:MAG: sigma-70 family RNA polymerase sigma factor [Bryobacteraceae bacterium]|nr:sigma-70 family RNA polymerase sigma factor [Bryobacteraceae bacterium]